MQYTIKQVWDHLHEKVKDTYDIFKSFFGEEHVDLQPHSAFLTFENNKDSIGLYMSIGKDTKAIKKDEKYGSVYDISEETLKNIEARYANQIYNIFIWWDKVTVTNEHDKYVVIQDLYAKVQINMNGTIPLESVGFLLNRATYPEIQFRSGYLHSHINGIPKSDFTYFNAPCLGSGPIIQTILTLKNEYDEAMWMLFCEELSKYVTVESLTGGPWRKLESIGVRTVDYRYGGYMLRTVYPFLNHRLEVEELKKHLKEFIKYYLENGHLSISYQYGYYTVGTPYYDYIIDISNAFIDFYNSYLNRFIPHISNLFEIGLLNKALVDNGQFYTPSYGSGFYSGDIKMYQNKYVLTFKGKEILTKIIPKEEGSEEYTSTILDSDFAIYLLKKILTVINYRYKNEHTGKQKESFSHSRTIYL